MGININLLKNRGEAMTPAQREYINHLAMDCYRMGVREGKNRAFYQMIHILEEHERKFYSLINPVEIPEEKPTKVEVFLKKGTTTKQE